MKHLCVATVKDKPRDNPNKGRIKSRKYCHQRCSSSLGIRSIPSKEAPAIETSTLTRTTVSFHQQRSLTLPGNSEKTSHDLTDTYHFGDSSKNMQPLRQEPSDRDQLFPKDQICNGSQNISTQSA